MSTLQSLSEELQKKVAEKHRFLFFVVEFVFDFDFTEEEVKELEKAGWKKKHAGFLFAP